MMGHVCVSHALRAAPLAGEAQRCASVPAVGQEVRACMGRDLQACSRPAGAGPTVAACSGTHQRVPQCARRSVCVDVQDPWCVPARATQIQKHYPAAQRTDLNG